MRVSVWINILLQHNIFLLKTFLGDSKTPVLQYKYKKQIYKSVKYRNIYFGNEKRSSKRLRRLAPEILVMSIDRKSLGYVDGDLKCSL